MLLLGMVARQLLQPTEWEEDDRLLEMQTGLKRTFL
jgi:hypothetical protein